MLRRAVVALLTTTTLLMPGSVALAGESEDQQSGSLVQQVLSAADESLGADSTVAVVRAYDRGYDVLQIIEALFEGLVAVDGTITDESNGTQLPPFREPSNVIKEDATANVRLVGTGETIALDVLERGVVKTTKKLDKKLDFEARAKSAGVSEETLLTMLSMLMLMAQGYSPEQIIIDGLAAGGIKAVPGPPGALLVDEKGKRIKPDGVEESPEHEEAADQVDSFVNDIVDTIAGIDPRSGADIPIRSGIAVEVEITGGGDSTVTIVGKGEIGAPRKKSLRGYVAGIARGELTGAGECYVDGLDPRHPYEVSGTLKLGFSGPVSDDGTAKIRIAPFDSDLTVAGDNSGCTDLVRDLASSFELITFGPVTVKMQKGQTGTADTSIDGDPFTIAVRLG
jgi:hypothetical protein